MSAQSLNARIERASPAIRLKLFTEVFVLGDPPEERVVPALSLSFDYDGVCLRASDRRQRFFVGGGAETRPMERELEAERAAQCLLESFGAVELDCIDDCAAPVDSEADYVLAPGGNVHSWCSFFAYGLPELERLGWVVDVAADYPYRVIDGPSDWYVEVSEDPQRNDWFGLDLGIEVNGQRINLLPALVEILRESPDDGSLQSIVRTACRARAVKAGGHGYLTIPPERLRALLRVLLELYQGEGAVRERLEFPALQAPALAKLKPWFEEGQAQAKWDDPTGVSERAERLVHAASQATLQPPGLRATLRPYQAEGLAWLQQLTSQGLDGVLADDMGLGKTLQTIAHLAAEKAGRRLEHPALIVMPTSLLGNWQRELERFAPHLRRCVLHGPRRHRGYEQIRRSSVVLTTYPVLVRDLERFQEYHFHLLILDEAQAIKNPRSLAFRAVCSLDASHRLSLTGTPVENNLEELWAQFRFLMPELLGEAAAFNTRFRYPIEREGDSSRLNLLRERVSPYILRRMKESVARELPAKTEIIRPVELDGPQRDLYESIRVAAHADVRRAIRDKGIAGSTVAILDALMKLRQACCHPQLVNVPSAVGVERSAKYDLFFELLPVQLEQGRRVLVFSQFTRMLALLAQGLHARGIGYVLLTGSTQDRQGAVDAFQRGDARVFLISLKAGGTGLNLTAADTVIHYDPWWNAAAQAQATDRAYRIGQTRPVFVYSLIVAGSVEERMLALQQRKRQLADTLLGTRGGALSGDELDDLFAPLNEGSVSPRIRSEGGPRLAASRAGLAPRPG